MKLSARWLGDWIDLPRDVSDLSERLTVAGLEVEGSTRPLEPEDAKLDGVSIARVLDVLPHPNADRLHICVVDTGAGGGKHRVVCGAPNVRKGEVYPYAPPGALLPGMKIESRKVRGENSEGMLCSSAELGLGDYYGDGLMTLPRNAPLGVSFYHWLELDDTIISFDLTPNRGDCLSVYGLACEVASLYDRPHPKLGYKRVSPSSKLRVGIKLSAPEDCPYYTARVIEGVRVASRIPWWMAERLRRCGVRPVNSVVDICNYCMLDVGQPMHAFDLQHIKGDIDVRRARAGETLSLLDGTKSKLNERDLLIADSEQPLALAGLMGGADSAVSDTTRNILLESAWFDPRVLAGRALAHGVSSDAAHRFERGVDPELAEIALERCSALLLGYAGGKAGKICVAAAKKPVRPTIMVRHSRVERLLGLGLSRPVIRRLLARLGARVRSTWKGWKLIPPSRRRDLNTEVDILEEIARLHGYQRLPTRLPDANMSFRQTPHSWLTDENVANRLVGLGYQEVVNYSLVTSKAEMHTTPPPLLANSISENMRALRTSLLPGLLNNMSQHQRRQIQDMRLFEIGNCFAATSSAAQPDSAPRETARLAMLLCGRRVPESWGCEEQPTDLYDLKADLEALLSMTGKDWDLSRAAPKEASYLLDPNSCVGIPELDGIMGVLDARWARHWSLRSRPLMVELDLRRLTMDALHCRSLSAEQPALSRDLAIVVPESAQATALKQRINNTATRTLVSLSGKSATPAVLEKLLLFDVYRGSNVAQKHKSMAYHLHFRHPERALLDSEVDTVCEEVMIVLNKEFGATLRDF